MEQFEHQVLTGATQKQEFLKEFFSNNNVTYDTNNIPVISNKFLYLYGNKDSGKQFYIEEVAKQVLGDDWKSKVYLKIDEGQKFPYKLHAHKTVSSVKVILISHSVDNYKKWKELYSNTLVAKFINDTSEEGFELTENNEAIYKITLRKWGEYNGKSFRDFKAKISEITKNNEEIKKQIYEATTNLVQEMNFFNINKSQFSNIFK